MFDRRDGRVVMSVGSPGGAPIIHYTAKTLIGTLDWGLDPQAAIALPNFGSLNGPTLLERGRFAPATIDALKARGHTVLETDLTSGLQALHRTRGGLARRRRHAARRGGAGGLTRGVLQPRASAQALARRGLTPGPRDCWRPVRPRPSLCNRSPPPCRSPSLPRRRHPRACKG